MWFYYCDANPLLRWAEAQVTGAILTCQRIAQELERLIKNPNNVVAISEVTLAEFYSNLFDYERDTNYPDFNSAQADQCLTQLMRWIDSGQIEILQQPPKLIENAMVYVKMATRERARSLKAWDAAHLVEACFWAKSINSTVYIITGDSSFRKFLEVFPEFSSYVNLYNPDTKTTYP